ncbi:hypothetical protein B0H19DRAFT_1250264 [Mycena capillaripes]|nr:hypothetical protein B0H19DRAFT_1250264 [Mycena capillaripes]
MRNNTSPLHLLQIVLGSLSLVSNHSIRYTLLFLVAAISIAYNIHFERPSKQLDRLQDAIQQVEKVIDTVKSQSFRHHLSFAQEELRLLEVKRSASMIQHRILETNSWTWKTYRRISRDIAGFANEVKKIETAVQLDEEVERQRRFTGVINDSRCILATGRCVGNLTQPIPSIPDSTF